MKQFFVSAFIITVIYLTTTISLSAQNREQRQMMADMRMLQEQTLQLQLLIETLDRTLQTIIAQLEEEASTNRRAFADQKLLVDNLSGGVSILRETVDDTNVRLSSLSQELSALRLEIPTASALLANLMFDPETGEPIEPLGSPEPAILTIPGVSPQRMYDTAWTDYTTGQWALAIQGFEAYIQTFPNSELSDDAQFYIGQTYYADGQFEEAVEAFDQVLVLYPDGTAVAEASYKRGLSLDMLGETDGAKEMFELVIERHPNSTMATLAQQALTRLNGSEQ